MNFFTADTHFSHKSIIKYTNRPFLNIFDMNDYLIDRWNSVISDNDVVWHLGDFSFCKPQYTLDILNKLNGTIHLIAGNHDLKMKERVKSRFASYRFYHELYIQDKDVPKGRQHIILSHYPFASWNKMRYGTWMLHGHCHGYHKPIGNSYDVGVDTNDYTPVSYNQLKFFTFSKK